MTAGYVYFIQRGNDGPVKIGFSRNPRVRIRKLQEASGDRLRCLCVAPGTFELERRTHLALHHHRIAREWFHPAPDVLARAAEMTIPLRSDDPSDIETPVSEKRAWLMKMAARLSDKEGARLTGLTEEAFRNVKSGDSAISFDTLTRWCRNDRAFAMEYCDFIGLILPGEAEMAAVVTRLVNAHVRRKG